ncbi:MAG: class I SAM-dependent RNA methyltransferase [Clostridia bacterium]
MEFLASAAFGLEGLVKRDLERLGAEGIHPRASGGVSFEGDLALGFRANLWLRTADRVLLVMGRFEARSFEELFEGVKKLPWSDILPKDACLPVKAQCARSQLMSPSDCQSIVKKAVVERIKADNHIDWLPETGATHEIDVAIHEDVVTVSLNTSGPALNRRGYRTWNGEAPLRETLAAALVFCSPWRTKMRLVDPCCGTGTLLIEAAYVALDRAPGLTREFDMEKWPAAPKEAMLLARSEARKRYALGKERPIDIVGSDNDPSALELAKKHVAQAGLEGMITLSLRDVADLTLTGEAGVILTNPPYGDRMGDRKVAQAVARKLGALYNRSWGWALCAITTSDKSFEIAFGSRADKRRRLYNGRIECEFLTFSAPGDKKSAARPTAKRL